jgi:hypothetical protein
MDNRWSKMKADLEANNALGEKAAKLPFSLKDNLIWFNHRQNNCTRLCIPQDRT